MFRSISLTLEKCLYNSRFTRRPKRCVNWICLSLSSNPVLIASANTIQQSSVSRSTGPSWDSMRNGAFLSEPVSIQMHRFHEPGAGALSTFKFPSLNFLSAVYELSTCRISCCIDWYELLDISIDFSVTQGENFAVSSRSSCPSSTAYGAHSAWYFSTSKTNRALDLSASRTWL
jgi:hypothetical protein